MARPEIHTRISENLPKIIPRRYGRTRGVRCPEDLPLDFEDQMEEFGKQGYSITEVRAHFDINYNLWSKWYRGWPDFRDIVERFQTLAEAFWLKFGKDNLGNKFFNSGLYSTCMFMRFKHARHIEKYLEDTGNKEDTEALERAEDARLDDLFSGGTGNIEPPKRSPEPVRKAEDAEWMEVDLRTRPK